MTITPVPPSRNVNFLSSLKIAWFQARKIRLGRLTPLQKRNLKVWFGLTGFYLLASHLWIEPLQSSAYLAGNGSSLYLILMTGLFAAVFDFALSAFLLTFVFSPRLSFADFLRTMKTQVFMLVRVGVGICLFIIPGLIEASRLIYSPYLISVLPPGADAQDAIRASHKLSQGRIILQGIVAAIMLLLPFVISLGVAGLPMFLRVLIFLFFMPILHLMIALTFYGLTEILQSRISTEAP